MNSSDWQSWWRDAGEAWWGLRRRTLRSVLSGLGICIGVLALIAMLSISEGARVEIQQKIASLGTDTVRIERAQIERSFGTASIANVSMGLTRDDAEFLANAMGPQIALGYYSRHDKVSLAAGSVAEIGTAVGAAANWFVNERLTVSSGRALQPSDLAAGARICVVGSALALRLRVDVGSVMRVGVSSCDIVGVLSPRGQLLTEGTGLASLDFDDAAILPYTAFSRTEGSANTELVDGVVARIVSGDRDREAVQRIAATLDGHLQRRHRGIADYRIVVPQKLLEEARSTQALFQLVMGSIAGLSLLVGGIGVMNIMLANIAEQTREIGLRMALGAPASRIVSLYLWHAVLLCLGGSAVGLCGGVLVALSVQSLAGWPVAFAVESLLMGPTLALLAGVVFGLHPARRAARLDPVAALRDV
ncbi:MAG: ABC transporter permease [Pseudomonadota bacterium]